MFTPDQVAALDAPLNKANVKERTQSGRTLSYLEGWMAIAEANRIFGFDGWDRETVDLRLLGEPRKVGDNMRVGYSCRVRITVRAGGQTIARDGCGFGSGIDKDVDQAHESALKEAETDAMKRALMTFGNPFGLALYDKTQANVQTSPPPLSGACLMACDLLKASKTPDELREFWGKNKDGLKRDLDPHEYAKCVEAMQAEAARLKPASQEAA